MPIEPAHASRVVLREVTVRTHHCPSCDLIFDQKTVLEYHLRNDHPNVHFDYPDEHPANGDWPMSTEPSRYSWRPTYPVRRTP